MPKKYPMCVYILPLLPHFSIASFRLVFLVCVAASVQIVRSRRMSWVTLVVSSALQLLKPSRWVSFLLTSLFPSGAQAKNWTSSGMSEFTKALPLRKDKTKQTVIPWDSKAQLNYKNGRVCPESVTSVWQMLLAEVHHVIKPSAVQLSFDTHFASKS